jgi:AraC-like DNA-binding protein
MAFSFSDILFTLVLFLLLFISVFLFTSDKGKRISNVLIGSFFLSICLNLGDSFLLLKQVYFQYPAWAGWGSNLLLVCGPLIFFYTQSVLYKDFRFTKGKFVHFLPFIILFVIAEVSYLIAGRQIQVKILTGIVERKIPAVIYLASCGIYVHFSVYLFAALRSVRKYHLAATSQYSDSRKVTLRWLKTTIYFFLALMVISAINGYLSFESKGAIYFLVLSLTVFLLLLFIIFVLFKALRNPAIFSVWEEKEVDEAVKTARYATSPLPGNEKKQVLDTLLRHMQSHQPYLEPELTLNDLAFQISVKPKILSQVINELAGRNFFEFINHYRIEEAKKRLTNPKDKKITVLEVMYEVGFNSKSSFNTLFKKYTGVTPGEFKKSTHT